MDYETRIWIKSFLQVRISSYLMYVIEVFTKESGEVPIFCLESFKTRTHGTTGASPSVEPLAFVFPPLKVEEAILGDIWKGEMG
uniref:Uncharacterized protein n=1 Tax=Tanacetum cinerariifolium TaxID=118510 RepID=A0A6L2MJV7_TANCI|nr:hypothetical protein [Tanacetum cinerariifolium]